MPPEPSPDIGFKLTGWAEKALKKLTKQKPSPILAEMNAFTAAWQKGVPLEVFHARYSLKPVSSDERCRARGHVFQIRIVKQQYRALMTFVEAERTFYWLDVFVKNPTDQDNHIRTACDRALRLQERAKK